MLRKAKITRGVLVTLILLSLVTTSVGSVAAQSNNTITNTTGGALDGININVETPFNDEESSDDEGSENIGNSSSLIHQFEDGGELNDVVYRDGSTYVTLSAGENSLQSFAISESISRQGQYEKRTVRLGAGQTRTVELPASNADVSVGTPNDGFLYTGGSVIVLRDVTTLVAQIGVPIGAFAAISSGLFAYGRKRRKYENTYKELFSEKRKSIKTDEYDSLRDRASAWVERRFERKSTSVIAIALLSYTLLALVGLLPTPGEIWDGLGNAGRFALSAFIIGAPLSYPFMSRFVSKIYNPTLEFILDLDAEDCYKSAGGDKSGKIAAYSASPDRITDCDVDGAVSTINTDGGRCHLMRGFDPEQNEAEGSPPELADDRELLLRADNIDSNRKRLEEFAGIATDMISAMPSTMKLAEFEASLQTDSFVREDISMGDRDGLFGVMESALDGTSYENIYTDNVEDTQLNEDDGSDNNDTEPGEESDNNTENGGEER